MDFARLRVMAMRRFARGNVRLFYFPELAFWIGVVECLAMAVNHDHVEVFVVADAKTALGMANRKALRWILPVTDFGVSGVNAVARLGRGLVLVEDMHAVHSCLYGVAT